MIKKLSSIGGSLGLVIDKPILDLYRIDKSTELEITPEEGGFNIRIVRDDKRKEKLEKIVDDSHKKFGRMFKNLA